MEQSIVALLKIVLQQNRGKKNCVFASTKFFLKIPYKDVDTTLIKSKLEAFILPFVKGREKNSISLDLDNSVLDEKKPTSIAKKLFDAIEECKSPIKSINRLTNLDT